MATAALEECIINDCLLTYLLVVCFSRDQVRRIILCVAAMTFTGNHIAAAITWVSLMTSLISPTAVCDVTTTSSYPQQQQRQPLLVVGQQHKQPLLPNESLSDEDIERIIREDPSGLQPKSSNFDSTTLAVLISLFVCLIAFGAAGNGLVCYVVLANSHMRSPRNVLILNLAASDLMLCCLTQPFNLMKVRLQYLYRLCYKF